jgi:hypothetical protein
VAVTVESQLVSQDSCSTIMAFAAAAHTTGFEAALAHESWTCRAAPLAAIPGAAVVTGTTDVTAGVTGTADVTAGVTDTADV